MENKQCICVFVRAHLFEYVHKNTDMSLFRNTCTHVARSSTERAERYTRALFSSNRRRIVLVCVVQSLGHLHEALHGRRVCDRFRATPYLLCWAIWRLAVLVRMTGTSIVFVSSLGFSPSLALARPPLGSNSTISESRTLLLNLVMFLCGRGLESLCMHLLGTTE